MPTRPMTLGGAVEQGVEAVGLHGCGVADETVRELRGGHGQVEEQHDPENVADAAIAIGRRSHGAPRSGGQRGYGRGTRPTRSRTLASVRAAMASARSAPVLSTSSVKLLSASSSRMRAWMGARAFATTSPRSALRSA